MLTRFISKRRSLTGADVFSASHCSNSSFNQIFSENSERFTATAWIFGSSLEILWDSEMFAWMERVFQQAAAR